MSSKKKMTPQARARQQKLRSDLAVLKRKGVYTGDAKRAKGNSYQRAVIRENRALIEGQAKAVTVDKKYVQEQREKGHIVRNRKEVVQADKNERVRFNEKERRFEATAVEYGVRVRRLRFKAVHTTEDIPRAPEGQTYRYRVKFPKGDTARFEDISALILYMDDYAPAKAKNAETRRKFREFWTGNVDVEILEPYKKRRAIPDDIDPEDYE